MSKIKTVLLSDMPEAVSLWRTDIENAPRDGIDILIMNSYGYCYLVYPDNDNDYTWKTSGPYYDIYQNREIPYWMPIPEIPE